MNNFDKHEAIHLLLEGMAITGKSFQYINSVESAGITAGFPGNGFTEGLHNLKKLTLETEEGYKEMVRILGSIPVRFGFGAAQITELTGFQDGQWQYKYVVDGQLEPQEFSSTTEHIQKAFWNSLAPADEFES